MPATAAKDQYQGQSKACVPRTISLDRQTDDMLMKLSGGRYSACLRLLIAQEFGRRQVLNELRGQGLNDVVEPETRS
jgi:hypothetical protein